MSLRPACPGPRQPWLHILAPLLARCLTFVSCLNFIFFSLNEIDPGPGIVAGQRQGSLFEVGGRSDELHYTGGKRQRAASAGLRVKPEGAKHRAVAIWVYYRAPPEWGANTGQVCSPATGQLCFLTLPLPATERMTCWCFLYLKVCLCWFKTLIS